MRTIGVKNHDKTSHENSREGFLAIILTDFLSMSQKRTPRCRAFILCTAGAMSECLLEPKGTK
ncbi:hypothetical protein KL86CLO1_12596 [uncultured Eubacteriales bacterium]|uniref:Uncharacterized protein n=1 Tax=uncultured Eubacteriales bacterium TaxID=172733 RepID=A0A212KC12_9FIRM|nr:hypothetical protein KL86CLO1_12596 [uncultured Eubacteriales bacterium]